MRRTAEPCSKTLIAVTLPSLPSPNCIRPRVRTVPANSRAYAIFSPAGPRSTLKTEPDTGPPARPSAAGSSSAMPDIRLPAPAPVMAEPKKTGYTRDLLTCAASSAQSRPDGICASPPM